MSFLSKIYQWRRQTTAWKLQKQHSVSDDRTNMLIQQAINSVRKSSDKRWTAVDSLLVDLNVRVIKGVMLALPKIVGVQPLQAPLGICYALDRIRDGGRSLLTANSHVVSVDKLPLSMDLSESAFATLKVNSAPYKNVINIAAPQLIDEICAGVVAQMFDSVDVIETEDGSPAGIRRAIESSSRLIAQEIAPANAIIVTCQEAADAIIEACEDVYLPALYEHSNIQVIGRIGGKMSLILAPCGCNEIRNSQAIVTHINGTTDAGCIYAPYVLVAKDGERSTKGHLTMQSQAATVMHHAAKYYQKINIFK